MIQALLFIEKGPSPRLSWTVTHRDSPAMGGSTTLPSFENRPGRGVWNRPGAAVHRASIESAAHACRIRPSVSDALAA